MTANQKIHDAKLSKWLTLFQEKKESGLTVEEWCSQKGFSKHTYYYWKRVAKEAYSDSVLPDIIPLCMPADAAASLPRDEAVPYPASPEIPGCHNLPELYNSHNLYNNTISISINDIRIEVGSSTSNETIGKMIEVLRHA